MDQNGQPNGSVAPKYKLSDLDEKVLLAIAEKMTIKERTAYQRVSQQLGKACSMALED